MRDKSTLVWVLAVICKWIRHTHQRTVAMGQRTDQSKTRQMTAQMNKD